MAFVTFFFVVAFSLKDVHLLHAADNLVLAMECGVSMFISTYFRLRGKEEHKILDCKGTGGSMFFALVFLVLLIPV
jgi:hypothetical protein